MKNGLDILRSMIEQHLATDAIQAGLGANSWEQMATLDLLEAMKNVTYLRHFEAREILEVLGEKGQKKLHAQTLNTLLELC